MQILEGVVGTVGAGTWEDGGGGGVGWTTLSVFEIGEHRLRRLVLPDDLRGYIAPGQRARIMIGREWPLGFTTRPVIAAVEVNGTKARVNGVLPQVLLTGLVVGGVVATFSPRLALVACGATIAFYLRGYLDLKSF